MEYVGAVFDRLVSEAGLGLLAVQFLVCAAVILVAGIRLVRSGDAIGEMLGLNRAWIGLAFLAVVTSLPELTTSVGSVKVIGIEAADLGVGNALGASTYNLMILAMLDLAQGRGPLLLQVETKHILSAALSVVMVALVGFGVALGVAAPQVAGHAGWIISVLLLVTYLVIMRTLFVFEKRNPDGRLPSGPPRYSSRHRAYLTFAVSAFFTVAAGIWLVRLGDRLSELPIGGVFLGKTFVGTMILAVCTTLPEVVVSVSAFRIGGIDMAVGTIFGSNTCNMVFPAIMDFVTPSGTVFLNVSSVHLLTALLAISITMVAVAGLKLRTSRSILNVGWDVAAMVLMYLGGMYAIFVASSSG